MPAISISGTKKSPRSKRAPTSSSEGISASNSMRSGVMPVREALVGQVEHRGRVADQRLVVQALEDLVVVHAASFLALSVSETRGERVGLCDQQRAKPIEVACVEP